MEDWKSDFKGFIGRERSRIEYIIHTMKDMNNENYKELVKLTYGRKTWRCATNWSKDFW